MATTAHTRTARAVASTAPLLTVAAFLLVTGCTSPAPTPHAEASTSPSRKLYTPETLLGMPKSMSRELTAAPRSQLEKLKREVGEPTSAVGWAYGGETPDADAVFISGASGKVADPAGAVERALQPYRITNLETVDAGQAGGEARCGRGRTEDGSYLTACGWADRETVGVVAFVSSRPRATAPPTSSRREANSNAQPAEGWTSLGRVRQRLHPRTFVRDPPQQSAADHVPARCRCQSALPATRQTATQHRRDSAYPSAHVTVGEPITP